MKKLTIVKLDHQGREVDRYWGEVLSHTDSKIVLETHFAGDEINVGGIVLREGDSFHETFYFRRWYNIFEIYDGGTGQIKGWYCNVCHPAAMDGDAVSYRDLALDLLVFPDGKQIVLDEDEFEDLQIPIRVKNDALAALRELQTKFKREEAG
jgi:protein associated with RNAse G/E